MYRKIIVILINMIDQINLQLKAHILLLSAFIFLLLNTTCCPFLKKRVNNLESLSNLSTFLILVAGSLFLNGESDSIKFMSYCLIFSLNLFFTLNWIISMISAFHQAYRKFITRYLEKFIPKKFLFRKIIQKARIKERHKADQDSTIKLSFSKEKKIIIFN
jgi:hypothetical protein